VEAREIFTADLKHRHRIDRRALRQARGWWQGWLERFAFSSEGAD
jgi:hypothetical protein